MTPDQAGPETETAPERRGERGGPIVVVDAVGTVALLMVTLASALTDTDAVQLAGLVVSTVLFAGGCIGFAIGFVRAAGRSREEVIDLAGLFYLTGSAPRTVRRQMLGLWFAQIGVAAASIAVADPPFAVMAPVWGIGLITLWASLHATFPPRPAPSRR